MNKNSFGSEKPEAMSASNILGLIANMTPYGQPIHDAHAALQRRDATETLNRLIVEARKRLEEDDRIVRDFKLRRGKAIA